MTRSRVLIRCDGTPEAGLGHLVRALSVADAGLARGWDVTIAGDVSSEFGRRLVEAAGVELVDATDGLGTIARGLGASVVHVDDYVVDGSAYEEVHAAGAVFSSMEDDTFGRRTADIAIDSTLGAERIARPADGSGVVLRGVTFAPMRAAVLQARARRHARLEIAHATEVNALVVMGGTDATGSAATVAAVCRAAAGIDRVTVNAPASQWEAIRDAARGEIELVEPDEKFLDRVVDADLVISTSSTTAWELACIGAPTLVTAVVANQGPGYRALLDAGVSRGIGEMPAVRSDPFAARLVVEAAARDLRAGRSWAARGMSVVDGLGARRIVDAWGLVRRPLDA